MSPAYHLPCNDVLFSVEFGSAAVRFPEDLCCRCCSNVFENEPSVDVLFTTVNFFLASCQVSKKILNQSEV